MEYFQLLPNLQKWHRDCQGTPFNLLRADLETGSLAWHWRVNVLHTVRCGEASPPWTFMSEYPSSKCSLEFQPKYPPSPAFSSWANLQVHFNNEKGVSQRSLLTMSEDTAPDLRAPLNFISKVEPL